MSRSRFDTGEKYQAAVAVWVRRRLVDQKGIFRNGQRRITQYGVVLADGVGLGKTWEALAASALLLVERSKQTVSGEKKQRKRRRAAKLLVLCPPGLVSKWTREIRDPKGFRKRLESWTLRQPNRRGFVRATLEQPYEIRLASDLNELPRPRKKRKQHVLTEGVYVCNWNVVQRRPGSGNSRLAALRSQNWDVVIVDEAHHREARKALNTILRRCNVHATLLLSATPFQLDPKELHPLLGTIVDTRHGDHKVLSRPPVVRFVRSLERFFDKGDPPEWAEKTDAEQHVRQLIARNQLRASGRRFFVINQDGLAHRLDPPPDLRSEHELHDVIPLLIQPDAEFQQWYFQRRLELAGAHGTDRTFVPTKLRRALSTAGEAKQSSRVGPPYSPRMDSLFAWARQQIEYDLEQFVKDGMPRKILVFTSFVDQAANELKRGLEAVTRQAWLAIRESQPWQVMAHCAQKNLDLIQKKVDVSIHRAEETLDLEHAASRLQDVFRAIREFASILGRGESLFRDLCGHRRFANMVVEALVHRIDLLTATAVAEGQERWQRRLHRYELRRLDAVIRALRLRRLASTYTGMDDRREREASGEAFCSPLGPWVLVASNVGSEGIDLQALSAHLVHFDIEWNPARMEQREGRIDRVGRQLKEHVNVYYLLVRGTYDERMLYQLVARQRWHSVLLGRPAARFAKDRAGAEETPLLDLNTVQKMTLNLRPVN